MLKGFGETEEDEHAAKKKDDSDDHEDKAKTGDWPHPIAKLAAHVLDFDLKYVDKRLKRGDDGLPAPPPPTTPGRSRLVFRFLPSDSPHAGRADGTPRG